METERNISLRQLQTERAAFLAETRLQIDNPPNGDPVTAAFNDAVLVANVRIPACRELTHSYILGETILSPSYRNNKYLKAHQEPLIDARRREALGYPENFRDPAVWYDFMAKNLSDPQQPVYRRIQRRLDEPLQVNRRQRAKVVAFAAGALERRGSLEGPITVHEYGSAANLVMRALALHQIDRTPVLQQDNEVDDTATDVFNDLAGVTQNGGRNSYFGQGIGIEMMPPKTQKDFQWVKSCTLDPLQFDAYVPGGMEETNFDILLLASPPKPVTTLKADLLNLSRRQAAVLEENPADIVFAPHVLSQIPGQLDQAIETMLRYVKKDGLLIVNEYAAVDEDDPRQLRLAAGWYKDPFLCQTLILEAAAREEGFYPALLWDTAHCKRAKLAPGIGRLTSAFTAVR